MSMNLDQARVVDPILTEFARGYRKPELVGHVLFPRVDVTSRGGQVLEFGREAFYRINARRAPGGSTQTISYGHAGQPYFLVQDALNAPIPREILEEAKTVPKIDMGKRAVNSAMYQLTLLAEYEQAELATDPAQYGDDNKEVLSGSDQWGDPASDPVQQVQAAKEVVRHSAAVDPNRMVITKPAFNVLQNHPRIVERFKYTSSDSVTAQMLANLFELDQLAVAKAVGLNEDDGEDAKFKDIWGNAAVLAYVPNEPQGMEEPSYGYTYTLQGNPFVEKPYWDNDKKSWVYGVTYERKPVIAGAGAGYLFQNVVDPASLV